MAMHDAAMGAAQAAMGIGNHVFGTQSPVGSSITMQPPSKRSARAKPGGLLGADSTRQRQATIGACPDLLGSSAAPPSTTEVSSSIASGHSVFSGTQASPNVGGVVWASGSAWWPVLSDARSAAAASCAATGVLTRFRDDGLAQQQRQQQQLLLPGQDSPSASTSGLGGAASTATTVATALPARSVSSTSAHGGSSDAGSPMLTQRKASLSVSLLGSDLGLLPGEHQRNMRQGMHSPVPNIRSSSPASPSWAHSHNHNTRSPTAASVARQQCVSPSPGPTPHSPVLRSGLASPAAPGSPHAHGMGAGRTSPGLAAGPLGPQHYQPRSTAAPFPQPWSTPTAVALGRNASDAKPAGAASVIGTQQPAPGPPTTPHLHHNSAVPKSGGGHHRRGASNSPGHHGPDSYGLTACSPVMLQLGLDASHEEPRSPTIHMVDDGGLPVGYMRAHVDGNQAPPLPMPDPAAAAVGASAARATPCGSLGAAQPDDLMLRFSRDSESGMGDGSVAQHQLHRLLQHQHSERQLRAAQATVAEVLGYSLPASQTAAAPHRPPLRLGGALMMASPKAADARRGSGPSVSAASSGLLPVLSAPAGRASPLPGVVGRATGTDYGHTGAMSGRVVPRGGGFRAAAAGPRGHC